MSDITTAGSPVPADSLTFKSGSGRPSKYAPAVKAASALTPGQAVTFGYTLGEGQKAANVRSAVSTAIRKAGLPHTYKVRETTDPGQMAIVCS